MLQELLTTQFMPHGHCYFWQPGLLWTHVAADALIAAAYFSIPVSLLYFLRKKPNLRVGWVVVLFASFIVLCGLTHVFGIITIWNPVYPTEAVLKLICAAVSLVTAVALVTLVPRALTLRSAEELEDVNARLRDEVAARLRAERALSHKVSELEQSNRELEQFAYVVSHDLRAPLRSIAGFTQLLEKSITKGNQESTREYIDYIRSSNNHMDQLITDLLNLSRLQVQPKNLEPNSVLKIVDAACKLLSSEIKARQAEVLYDQLPVAVCDESQLTQLFQNLIGNGLKFQPAQGRPRISITARRSDTDWTFCVADNGIGVEDSALADIFQVFKRLHLQEEFEGNGIGLAICQKIVLRHGGRIWAEQAYGGGLQVCFTLPLPAQEAPEPAETGSQQGSANARFPGKPALT